MNWKLSNILHRAGNTNIRRSLVAVSGLAAVMVLSAAQPSDAQRVSFRYVGGRWSHNRHTGWNRYWGGPDIGFYYAPTPVYLVPGYAAPSYYSGPDFWTSNPSFGISLNFGGGGYYGGGGGYYGGGGGYYPRRYYSNRNYHSNYYGGRPQGTYHNYGGNSSGHYYGGNANGHSYGGSSNGHSYSGSAYGHSYSGRSSERGRR